MAYAHAVAGFIQTCTTTLMTCASARESAQCTPCTNTGMRSFYVLPPGTDQWSSNMGILISFLDQDKVKKSVEPSGLVENNCLKNHCADLWPSSEFSRNQLSRSWCIGSCHPPSDIHVHVYSFQYDICPLQPLFSFFLLAV